MPNNPKPTLTPDQIELLETCWRLDSAEDKVIAAALGIPVGACRGRMRRLIAKLGLPNRSGLLSRAVKTGLIHDPLPQSNPLWMAIVASKTDAMMLLTNCHKVSPSTYSHFDILRLH